MDKKLSYNQERFRAALVARDETFVGVTGDALSEAVESMSGASRDVTLKYLGGATLKALAASYGLPKAFIRDSISLAADAIAGEKQVVQEQARERDTGEVAQRPVFSEAVQEREPAHVPIAVEQLAFASGDDSWRDHTACDTTTARLFDGERQQDVAEAKRICGRCTVRATCLEYSLNTTDAIMGVWGGVDEKERRQLLRTVRQAARQS